MSVRRCIFNEEKKPGAFLGKKSRGPVNGDQVLGGSSSLLSRNNLLEPKRVLRTNSELKDFQNSGSYLSLRHILRSNSLLVVDTLTLRAMVDSMTMNAARHLANILKLSANFAVG